MREIFLSHSVSTLKKEISKTNIKGYSTMKKAQIVDLMVKNQARFSHIKMNQRKQKKSAPKPKKKVKKEELSQLKKFTGLTKAEANKLDPAELFGLLPSEISKKILNPKETGIKVAQNMVRIQSLYNSVKEILKIKDPKIKIDSEKGRLEGNKIYNDLLLSIGFYKKRGTDWRKIKERDTAKYINLRKALETPTKVKRLLRAIEREKLNTKIMNEVKNTKLRITEKMKKDIRDKYEGKRLFIVGRSSLLTKQIRYEVLMNDTKKNNHKDLYFLVHEQDGKYKPQDLPFFKMSYKEFIVREKQGLIYESK